MITSVLMVIVVGVYLYLVATVAPQFQAAFNIQSPVLAYASTAVAFPVVAIATVLQKSSGTPGVQVHKIIL